jgi:hypothetical protein
MDRRCDHIHYRYNPIDCTLGYSRTYDIANDVSLTLFYFLSNIQVI